MNYTFMPSLGHMAAVVIAVSLWTQKNAMTFLYNYYLSNGCYIRDEKWQQIEGEMSVKISHLPLPDILKEYLKGCIRPIGLQILKWLHTCSESGIKVQKFLVNDLCWTSNGTVNAKKTAACLIKNENLNICKRYELACVYCLENDIPELWDKIPIIRSKVYYSQNMRDTFRNKLALLWAYDMKGELDRLARPIATNWRYFIEVLNPSSPYQFAFEHSVVRGNRAGTEYFLQKLTSRERKDSLVRVAESVDYQDSNVFCFLLSQMDEEQLTEVFKKYLKFALVYFLEWPFQNLFMKMVSIVWDFLSVEDYDYLLNRIVLKVNDGFQDWSYSHLFDELWRKGTISHKRYVLDRCICGPLLTNLFKNKDMENIFLLVHDATVAERGEIVYYRKDIILLLIYNGEWNFLKLFVEHCPSAGDIVCKFRNEFQKRDLSSLAKEDMFDEKALLKKFFKSLNSIINIPAKVEWGKEKRRLKRHEIPPKLPK